MKPNQVKGTLFSELDDEKLYNVSFISALPLMILQRKVIKTVF